MGFKKAFTSTIKRVSALAGAVALSDGPEPGPADLIGAAVEVGGFGAAISEIQEFGRPAARP